MPESLPAGPYRTVLLDDGSLLPWYIVPFDKEARCTGPLTRDHLINEVRTRNYTDVFLFSHGWNNDWEAASQRYESFLNGYLSMMRAHKLQYLTAHQSILVGIFWPSTALVMPWERGPDFAATAGAIDAEIAETRRDIDELAADVRAEDRDDYYRLVQRPKLSETEGRRLAEILSRSFARYAAADADVAGGTTERSPEDLLDAWSRIPVQRATAPPTGTFGFAGGVPVAAAPEAAFSLSDLDPRHIVRAATVLQMKDRAATVGARGVGPLLRDLKSAKPSVKVHMIGHSYGSIVMLSALCYPPDESAPLAVESLLLLQPAVSQWCFAENVAGQGYPGGYRRALKQVKRPIFTTFTRKDVPLTNFFHLAVRRARDLGQPQIAAEGLPQPPSRYAALGGFGPAGLSAQELQIVDMTKPPDRYQLRTPVVPRICALNGNTLIDSHGDVSTAAAWWALFQQVDDNP